MTFVASRLFDITITFDLGREVMDNSQQPGFVGRDEFRGFEFEVGK
jgi:hypothetical protein